MTRLSGNSATHRHKIHPKCKKLKAPRLFTQIAPYIYSLDSTCNAASVTLYHLMKNIPSIFFQKPLMIILAKLDIANITFITHLHVGQDQVPVFYKLVSHKV